MTHIAAGGAGLVTGAVALVAPKGARLHRVVGTVFFVSMLVMTTLGTVIAAGMREPMAFVPGLVTFYLVATAWAAVKRPAGQAGRFEMGAGFGGLGIAAAAVGFALAASAPPLGIILALFGALAAFAGWQDLRVARAGGVTGPDRLARHLWRMCTALTIAAFSFFLGQQDEFPKALQGAHNAVPALAVLSAMIFHLLRLRRPARRMAARGVLAKRRRVGEDWRHGDPRAFAWRSSAGAGPCAGRRDPEPPQG